MKRQEPDESGPATAKMVARIAGVSTTTVSRVVNGKRGAITEETAARVLEIAQSLDYRPNSLAVSLRKGTTRTIGLIVPDITDSYFHQVARGVEDAARDEGYVVILCNTDREVDKEILYLDALREKQVDGIIFAGAGIDRDRHLSGRHWSGAKVVMVGPHELDFPAIEVDNRAAIAAAVRHLAEQGCRRVACIGGEPHWLIHQVRLEGFHRGLSEAGLEPDSELVWLGDFRVQGGYDAVERAIAGGLEFDGIVSFNDYSALGAIEALRRHGRAVPDDVAVVGCDDIAISTMVDLHLTSIAFPLLEMGETAAQLVMRMACGETFTGTRRFPFELKMRASSLRAGG